jgi:hypothetical protein
VVHTPRRRARPRPRILYWFRTPPGVRVGRAALDEEAIRLIEEHHPEIEFDWPQILKGDEEAAPPPPPRAMRDPQRERPAPPAPPVPSPQAEIMIAAVPDEPLSAAHARLGSEGLARLRARYGEVMAGISRGIQDLERREELKGVAERINPDTWVTDDEVRAALEDYETTLASLREVIGRRRRRNISDPSGQASSPDGRHEPGDRGAGAPEEEQNRPEKGPLPEN